MDIVIKYKCYKFKRNIFLVDFILNIDSDKIDWMNINVPEEEVDLNYWQVPYMEQYLTIDGKRKVCEKYRVPSLVHNPCRVVFFIFKSSGNILHTPYGDFQLYNKGKMPKAFKKLIEYEDVD